MGVEQIMELLSMRPRVMKLILNAKGIQGRLLRIIEIGTMYYFKKFNVAVLGKRRGKSNELKYFAMI